MCDLLKKEQIAKEKKALVQIICLKSSVKNKLYEILLVILQDEAISFTFLTGFPFLGGNKI